MQPFSFASDDEHELSRGRTEVELLPLGAGDAAVIATRGRESLAGIRTLSLGRTNAGAASMVDRGVGASRV